MNDTIEIRQYELMCIFSGDMTEVDFEKELGEVRKMLQETAKAITHEDVWGRKEMAYKIRRQSRGYYVVFNFSAGPQQIKEIRNNIKLNQMILRQMLLVTPAGYDPERYKTAKLIVRSKDSDKDAVKYAPREVKPVVSSAESKIDSVVTPEGVAVKPKLAGQAEEEQLKKVERKLEEILDNPDIKIS